jgi:hypothetical protein
LVRGVFQGCLSAGLFQGTGADRMPLGVIRSRFGRCPALNLCGQLPAEVDRVQQAGIERRSTRGEQMRGITGEQHPAGAVVSAWRSWLSVRESHPTAWDRRDRSALAAARGRGRKRRGPTPIRSGASTNDVDVPQACPNNSNRHAQAAQESQDLRRDASHRAGYDSHDAVDHPTDDGTPIGFFFRLVTDLLLKVNASRFCAGVAQCS